MRRAITDLITALRGGYIGETPIYPRKLTNAVRSALGLRKLRPTIVFYYGDHDPELDELFGYSANPLAST